MELTFDTLFPTKEMRKEQFIQILEANNLKPGNDQDLNSLIADFSKPPKGTSLEELKEQESTTMVYKETI